MSPRLLRTRASASKPTAGPGTPRSQRAHTPIAPTLRRGAPGRVLRLLQRRRTVPARDSAREPSVSQGPPPRAGAQAMTPPPSPTISRAHEISDRRRASSRRLPCPRASADSQPVLQRSPRTNRAQCAHLPSTQQGGDRVCPAACATFWKALGLPTPCDLLHAWWPRLCCAVLRAHAPCCGVYRAW